MPSIFYNITWRKNPFPFFLGAPRVLHRVRDFGMLRIVRHVEGDDLRIGDFAFWPLLLRSVYDDRD